MFYFGILSCLDDVDMKLEFKIVLGEEDEIWNFCYRVLFSSLYFKFVDLKVILEEFGEKMLYIEIRKFLSVGGGCGVKSLYINFLFLFDGYRSCSDVYELIRFVDYML